MTALRSFITSGLKSKIILLQSYDEIASGIKTLDLPMLSIPGLFLSQKLNSVVSPQMSHSELPTPQIPPVALPATTSGKNRHRGRSQVRAETSIIEFTANSASYRPRENPTEGRKVDHSLVSSSIPLLRPSLAGSFLVQPLWQRMFCCSHVLHTRQ